VIRAGALQRGVRGGRWRLAPEVDVTSRDGTGLGVLNKQETGGTQGLYGCSGTHALAEAEAWRVQGGGWRMRSLGGQERDEASASRRGERETSAPESLPSAHSTRAGGENRARKGQQQQGSRGRAASLGGVCCVPLAGEGGGRWGKARAALWRWVPFRALKKGHRYDKTFIRASGGCSGRWTGRLQKGVDSPNRTCDRPAAGYSSH